MSRDRLFGCVNFLHALSTIWCGYDAFKVASEIQLIRKEKQRAKELSAFTEDFLVPLYLNLFADLGVHHKDVECLRNRTTCEGLKFLTVTLPLLGKAFDRALGSGSFSCPSSFKRKTNTSELPAFLWQFFRLVFDSDGSLLENASAEAIGALRQVFYLAYKAELPRDEGLDAKVCDAFVSVEQELARTPLHEDNVLVVASALVGIVTSGYVRGNPKHGPGVSSNVDQSMKNEARLSARLRSVANYGDEFFLNWRDSFDRLDRFPVWKHRDYYGAPEATQMAKVILVPKDSRGPRLISAEPFENMYIQQGIASWLVDRIEGHPLTSGRVNFRDQSINQTLAKEASEHRYWSTLDLKDASDRVSMRLVRRLFKEENLIADIENVRSTHTRMPDGRVIALSKHAPMGSALCFPVMALTLWSLLTAALTLRGVDLANEKVFVYGDDIIVPSEHATFCIAVLERYALRVNRDKSFINSHFSESCGADYFKGHDVTPIRLHECKISNKPIQKDPNVLVALVAKANLFSSSSFHRTAEFLYRRVERWVGPLPYGHAESPYLSRLIPTGMEDLVLRENSLREGLKWKKPYGYDHIGRSLFAWTIEPVRASSKQTYWGALMALSPTKKKFERTRGRHGWSYMSVPDFVGTDPLSIDFGYVTLPRKVRLVRRRFDSYSMTTVKKWNGELLV